MAEFVKGDVVVVPFPFFDVKRAIDLSIPKSAMPVACETGVKGDRLRSQNRLPII